MRDGFRKKLERQVRSDFPDASDLDVARMVEARRLAHMSAMTAKSIAVRRARKGGSA
jgi:hypothetical protein